MKIRIEKSWYYTAGTKYGWERDGLDVNGVGVSIEALHNNDELTLEINKKDYLLRSIEAIRFIKRYRSSYRMPGGTVIGIVSKSILEEL